jgi:hypothetical protein
MNDLEFNIPPRRELIYNMMQLPIVGIGGYHIYKYLNPTPFKEEEAKQKTRIKENYGNNAYADNERKRVLERIEFMKTTPLKDMPVISKDYNNMITKLGLLNNKISTITNTKSDNTAMASLLEELKFTVLYKHLEKQPDESFINPAHLFSVGAWCGAGTAILNALESDPKQHYKIDKICKIHDLSYMAAKSRFDIHRADIQMLLSILDEYTIPNLGKGIYRVATAETLPINEFIQYIGTLLVQTMMNPIKTITNELTGSGLLGNVLGGLRAIDYLSGNPGRPGFRQIISDIMFARERVMAIIGFGAIGMKLMYDISIGKATNTVYGYEETKFNPDEVSYLIREFESTQNKRLEENGYEPIDFQGMLELPQEDFEAVIATYTEPEVEQEEQEEDDEILDINEKEEAINEAEYLENLTNDLYEL